MKRVWAAVVIVLCGGGIASCSTDPETAKREYLADGERLFAEKRYAQAIVQYRNAVAQDPLFGEAHQKLTDAYMAVGDGQNALRASVRAADLMPDNAAVQIRAGVLHLVARQFPEARARATAVLEKDPKNARALILLGNALAALKDLDSAIEHAEQAIDEDPQLTLSYANLGALQMAKGDTEAAEAALRRAVEIAPRAADVHSALANFLWATGRLDEAEREFRTALEIDPKVPMTNRAMAALLLARNRLPEMEPYLKTYTDASGTMESQLVLADYYVRIGKSQNATDILGRWAKDENGFVPATLRLSALDFTGGRAADAYAKLNDIIRRQPGNEAAMEGKARLLLLERRNQEALTISTELVKTNPRSVRGQYTLGLALEANDAPDKAIEAYREVLRFAPSSVAAQRRLARLYLGRGNTKDALALSQQLVKTQSQSVDAQLLYAQALLRSGDIANAERELLRVVKAAPSSAEVHTWLGMLYEAKKDVRAARRSYERARELEPASDVALAGLVSADFAEKNPSAALARIEAQLAKAPNNPKLVLMSAMAYSAAGDVPRAEGAYRRLLQLDSNNFNAYASLGALYLRQNRLEDARKSFEEIARQEPKPVAAETMLGVILARQNKPADARKHYERALQLDPRAAVAANNLAWDYANTGGNLDVALQLAQTAKAELPDTALVTATLGLIYYKKGLNSIAVTTFREASKQSPSNPDIQYHLGLAYLQNGNKVEARSTLQQVLKMNPSSQIAAEVRRLLPTIQG